MATKPQDVLATPSMSDIDGTDDRSNVPATVDNRTLVLGTVEGDVSSSDIRLPRLQIAYGVGGLAENFHPGDLVLNGEDLLAKRGDVIFIVILSARQYWKEYLNKDQYASGDQPRTFQSEQEVHDNGGTTQWVNNVGPTFNRAMHLKLLIEQPKDIISGLFGIMLGDKTYAPAVWDVDKSAYRRVGPTVLTAARFNLRTRGLLSGVFSLSTRTEKINDNVTPVPVLRLSGHNSDETIEEITKIFNPTAAEAAPF